VGLFTGTAVVVGLLVLDRSSVVDDGTRVVGMHMIVVIEKSKNDVSTNTCCHIVSGQKLSAGKLLYLVFI
jgi:hypothetical protein